MKGRTVHTPMAEEEADEFMTCRNDVLDFFDGSPILSGLERLKVIFFPIGQ